MTLAPPEHTPSETGEFRPTYLMERVSKFLDTEAGASLNVIRKSVPEKAAWLDVAVRTLVAEGFVKKCSEGQANRHYNVHAYLETDDRVPASQPRPNRVRTRSTPTAFPRPSL